MPNHYTTIAICSPGYDFDCEAFNVKHEKSNLCEIVLPMPADAKASVGQPGLDPLWYTWANDKWGTIWGTYDAKAYPLGGDGSPVVIKFQSAWSPPSNLGKIAKWLKKEYAFERVAFVGFDPYNDSTKLLGTH